MVRWVRLPQQYLSPPHVPQLSLFSWKVFVHFSFFFCFFFFFFFRFLWFSLIFCGSLGRRYPLYGKFFFVFFVFVFANYHCFWTGLDDLFVTQNVREFNAFHSPGQVLLCACAIWWYGKFSISWTMASGSPSLNTRILSYNPFALVCYHRLQCD